MHYQFDLYGRFSGQSETRTERSVEVAPPELTPDYNWNGNAWVFAPNVQVQPVVIPAVVKPEPVQVVTIRQAKLALLAAGLLDDVDAAVAQADRATQIEWEYATEIRRDWPTLVTLQSALGLTDAQVDGLFVQAAAL